MLNSRLISGAKRYALADRTDPFAYARAVTHIKNGVASTSRPESPDYDLAPGTSAYYNADIGLEYRSATRANGSKFEWTVMSFRNVVRP
jgi:hypothetical protein